MRYGVECVPEVQCVRRTRDALECSASVPYRGTHSLTHSRAVSPAGRTRRDSWTSPEFEELNRRIWLKYLELTKETP